VDRDRGVGDRLAIPPRGRATVGTDEGLIPVDDDPDRRSVGRPVGGLGLDLDLLLGGQPAKVVRVAASTGGLLCARNASATSEANRRNGQADILGPGSIDASIARHGGHDPNSHSETLAMTDEHHHDTVVVESERGSGMGAILGIIAIIVLLVAVWWVALGPGSGSGSTTNNNNTINNGGNAPAATEPAPASS
jgi:hypothetical protein